MDVRLYPRALDTLVLGHEGRATLADVARRVRNAARANAPFPKYASAITTESGTDSLGPYADIGYAKSHPGFVLWFWEVGTKNHGPRPHLRPAVRPGI